MSEQDCTELIDLLSNRVDLLRSIGEGTTTKQDLVAARPVSRSTVDRGVRSLEEWGLIARERGEIRRTLQGDLVVTAYESFLEDVTGLCESGGVVEFLPREAPITLDLVRDATVVSGSQPTPHRPATEIEAFVTEADRLAGYVATVLPAHVDLYRQLLVENDCRMDLVFTDAVLDTLVSEFRGTVEATVDAENFRAYVTSTQIHCTLLLRENDGTHEVCVAAHDDHGVAGVIRNDTEAAMSWACDTFRSIRYDAAELTWNEPPWA